MSTTQIALIAAGAVLLGAVLGVLVWRYLLENRRRLAALLGIAIVSAITGAGLWEAFRPRTATGDTRKVPTSRIAQFIADNEFVAFSLQHARGLLDACFFAARGDQPPADLMTVPELAAWAATRRGALGRGTDRTTRTPPLGWQTARAIRDADLRARLTVDRITQRITRPSQLELGIVFRNNGADPIAAFSGTLLIFDRLGRPLTTQRIDATTPIDPTRLVTVPLGLPFNRDIPAEEYLATKPIAWLWVPEILDLGGQGRIVRTEADFGGFNGGCSPPEQPTPEK